MPTIDIVTLELANDCKDVRHPRVIKKESATLLRVPVVIFQAVFP